MGNDSLSCFGSHGIPQYFINGQYASKKKLNKITAIAQKEYDEKLLSLLKQKLHNVEELCGFYGERREDIIFEKLCKGRKNIVKPFRLPQSEFVKQWIDEEFDGKQKKVVRPDFVALNIRTLKVFILEHLGMLDKVGYYNTNLNKLDLYEKKRGVHLHSASDCRQGLNEMGCFARGFMLRQSKVRIDFK